MIHFKIIGNGNLEFYKLISICYEIITEKQLLASLEKECLDGAKGLFPVLYINDHKYSAGFIPEKKAISEKIDQILKSVIY